MANYEPKGLRFHDANRGEMILVAENEPYAGCLCYRHPDGQWVTLRKATADDYKQLKGLILGQPITGSSNGHQ